MKITMQSAALSKAVVFAGALTIITMVQKRKGALEISGAYFWQCARYS